MGPHLGGALSGDDAGADGAEAPPGGCLDGGGGLVGRFGALVVSATLPLRVPSVTGGIRLFNMLLIPPCRSLLDRESPLAEAEVH